MRLLRIRFTLVDELLCPPGQSLTFLADGTISAADATFGA
jgi:hypothetical protein